MALIEGIGDEVVQVFVYFFLFLIGVVAWWSTRITERPLVRTVLILERRSNRQTVGEPPPVPTEPTPSQEDKPMENRSVDEAEASSVPSEETNGITEADAVVIGATPNRSEVNESRPEDVSLRNRRLAYYDENATYSTISQGDGDYPIHCEENATYSSILQGDADCSIHYPSPVKPKSTTETVAPDKPSAEIEETLKPPDEPHNIRIRLKYLNDDLKMVDGNLEEQLGDFKRRIFSLELSGRKLVRLIFNGQVLGQDTWTLGHYGLFDNCVVHCLVHNPRTPPPSPNLNAREGSVRVRQLSASTVSNILLAGLSILLGLAWYGRYHYAHLYTATTTVALVGLTGLFTASLIGIYMPEFMQN